MADSRTFHIEIVTPRALVFSGEVTLVTLPGVVAPFQVLVNHAPIVTQLEIGDIRVVTKDDQELHFATSGGFVEMKNNVMTVIAETAEMASAIDAARAENAYRRAQERISEARRAHNSAIDMARAEASLARAMNRLQIAGRGLPI